MPVYIVCEECGSTRRVPPSHSGRRWCSWECRSAQPRNFRKNGTSERTCTECGSKFFIKKSKDRKFCSFDCYNDWRNGEDKPLTTDLVELHCPTCGDTFTTWPSRLADDRGKFCSRSCAMTGRQIRGRSEIADLTVSLWREQHPGLYGVEEYRVRRWAIDLAFPDSNIAIELDGEYWHSLPEMIEKDRRKDASLRSDGWTVVRIKICRGDTPEDLLQRMESCVLPLLRKVPA